MNYHSLKTRIGSYGRQLTAGAIILTIGCIGLQSVLASSGPQINTNLAVQLAGGQAEYGANAQATPGDSLNFIVYLENRGTATGSHPKITEHLDSRLTYVAASSTMRAKGADNKDHDYPLSDSYIKIQNDGHDITWAFADMAPQPNASIYLQFKAKLAPDSQFPTGSSTYANTAIASFDGKTSVTNPVHYTVTRFAVPTVTLSVKTEVKDLTLGYDMWYDASDAIIAPGDRVAYRMTVLNTGNAAATNVKLKNILPTGFTYAGNATLSNQENTTGTAVSGDAIVNDGYVFSSLDPHTGSYQRLQFEAIVPTACATTVTAIDRSQLMYQNAVKASDSVTTVIACAPSLTVIQDVQNPSNGQFVDSLGTIAANQILTYRILVGNTGSTTAVNPYLRDVLPAGFAYVANTLAIDGELQAPSAQSAFFQNGMLLTTFDPGHGKTITFKLMGHCLSAEASVANTTFIRANGIAETSDTVSVGLPQCQTVIPTIPTTPIDPVPTNPDLTPGSVLNYGEGAGLF